RALPALVRDEVVVRHGLGADEASLEVGVDHSRRLRRRIALVDGPRAHFLLAGSEVSLQTQKRVRGTYQPIESGALEAERLGEFRAVFRREFGELRLDTRGEGNHLGVLPARTHGLTERAEVRSLFSREFRVAHVRGVEHRL